MNLPFRLSFPMLRLFAWCAVVLSFTSATSAEVRPINNDEEFEELVIQSGEVWAVLFTSPSKGEDADKAETMLGRLAMKMSGVHFGLADARLPAIGTDPVQSLPQPRPTRLLSLVLTSRYRSVVHRSTA